MDKRIHCCIVLDTETTNSIEDPLCYDIGYAVIDLDTEEVLKTESYAVADIFLDKELMAVAFFADKIPQYWDEIANGTRKLARLSTIRKSLLEDCKMYGINEIYAFNVRFDYLSLNLTQRYITSSKYRYFTPYGSKFMDILKYARRTLKDNAEYRNFCLENNYLTKNGGNRYTAEIVYRFWFNNDFEEEHKGIDDVKIETKILLKCLAENPDFNCQIF